MHVIFQHNGYHCLTAVLNKLVYIQLLQRSADSPLNTSPLWLRTTLSDSALFSEYQRECCVVRKGVDREISKVQLCVHTLGSEHALFADEI